MTELDSHTLKTYRYLRLAMVTLVVMLAVSVVIEWAMTDPGCFQTSISAYYYTPVQGVFVGSLVSIGACMVVLKGNTEWEDILLNLGGMLASAVALVPAPDKGECRSVPMSLRDTPADIVNNMSALLAAGFLGLAVTVGIALAARRAGAGHRQPWDRRHTVGMVAAALVLGAGLAWFALDRSGFVAGAHYTAAIAFFVCIVGVVVLNARGYGDRLVAVTNPKRAYANRYLAIAVAMVASAAGMGVWKWLVGWDHALLWIEGTLIALFAVFWVSQTHELWNQGVREGVVTSPGPP